MQKEENKERSPKVNPDVRRVPWAAARPRAAWNHALVLLLRDLRRKVQFFCALSKFSAEGRLRQKVYFTEHIFGTPLLAKPHTPGPPGPENQASAPGRTKSQKS